MPIGGSVTQFPICLACGNEGRIFGTADWNCGRCRAMIGWEEETNEAGEDISHWVIKTQPFEGVLEALERGEDPFVHKPPTFDPHRHAKDLIHQRQAILSEGESVTIADLAKQLGASCKELIELGQTMGIFGADQGDSDTQLNYNQFTKLHSMWGIAIARHRTEPAEEAVTEEAAEEEKWQTDSAEKADPVEAEA